MIDKTDDTGKGPHGPGDAPKRPYATIDVEATEIGRDRGPPAAHGSSKPDLLARVWAGVAAALATAWSFAPRLAHNSSFLSHAAAGVAGAALTLAVTGLLGFLGGGPGGAHVPPDLAMRLAAVEKALPQQPTLPGDVAARLTGTETRLAKLQERVEAAQARLAADAKALEARIPAPDIAQRMAKAEAAIASLAAAESKPGDTKAVDQEIARLKGEAQGLRQGLDALKSSVEEQLKQVAKAGDMAPVMGKLAAFERELQGVLRTEGERSAGTRQVLLALDISNLRRAVDRGDSYARELETVRTAAPPSIDLSPLESSSRSGVPTLGALTEGFQRAANAAADAEREQPGASVLDRLMSGARSIVRWRKASYDANDSSVEAILARMEEALKNGHLAEVLAQGKRLPPKAASAMGDWLRKLEARTVADRAIADIEAGLKASLTGGRPPAPEGAR